MNEIKKFILYISIGLILGFSITFFYGQRRTDKVIDKYQTTIVELGATIDGLRTENQRVTDLNKSITERLNSSQSRLEDAEGLISQIGQGLSSSTGEVREIIEAIERVIEAISQYEDEE